MKNILLIGLGNPILGDDGIGWRVVEWVEPRLGDLSQSVECEYLSLGGLRLMERLIGFEHVVIVDAIYGQKEIPGTITCMPLDQFPDLVAGHTTSVHDTSLQTAIHAGRLSGATLPEIQNVQIIGIESEKIFEFTEEITSRVKDAIPDAGRLTIETIKNIKPYKFRSGQVAASQT